MRVIHQLSERKVENSKIGKRDNAPESGNQDEVISILKKTDKKEVRVKSGLGQSIRRSLKEDSTILPANL